MRVSSRVDYGVRALYDLACNGGSGPVQSRDIARRQGIPESYLHQLLGALNRGGLVRSTRGPQGGHRLAQGPDTVTVYDIWLVLEGRDRHAADERPRRQDVITDVWKRAQADFERQLRSVSLQELMRRSGSAPADYSI